MRTAENGWKARDWLRKTENGWERLRMAGRRAVHYHETTRPRDRETTRPPKNPGVLRHSQAFSDILSGILRYSQLCEVA